MTITSRLLANVFIYSPPIARLARCSRHSLIQTIRSHWNCPVAGLGDDVIPTSARHEGFEGKWRHWQRCFQVVDNIVAFSTTTSVPYSSVVLHDAKLSTIRRTDSHRVTAQRAALWFRSTDRPEAVRVYSITVHANPTSAPTVLPRQRGRHPARRGSMAALPGRRPKSAKSSLRPFPRRRCERKSSGTRASGSVGTGRQTRPCPMLFGLAASAPRRPVRRMWQMEHDQVDLSSRRGCPFYHVYRGKGSEGSTQSLPGADHLNPAGRSSRLELEATA
jgi:hypothetical protein